MGPVSQAAQPHAGTPPRLAAVTESPWPAPDPPVRRAPVARLILHTAQQTSDESRDTPEVDVGQALPGVPDAAVHLDGRLGDRRGRPGRSRPWPPRRRPGRPVRPQLVHCPGGVQGGAAGPLGMSTKASASRCCTAWNDPMAAPYCRRSAWRRRMASAHGPAHGPDHVGTGQRQTEGGPPGQVVGRDAASGVVELK